LCELRRRRAAFLEMAVDELELGERVTVHHGAAAELASGPPFDAAVARAFADAPGTWEAARPLVRPGGLVAYWAGSASGAADAPPEADPVEVPPPAALANAGPLVIMTRQ
jgi:16S rRNA G527 N7-methylase RsmG